MNRSSKALLFTVLFTASVVEADIVKTLVQVTTSLGIITCEKNNAAIAPGFLRSDKFVSFSSEIKRLQKLSKRNKKSYSVQIKRYQAKLKVGKAACINAFGTFPIATPTPNSTPAPSPSLIPSPLSPTATPTALPTLPTNPPGCYDVAGNTRCFGNSPLVGNIQAGQNLFSTCAGCHAGSPDNGLRNRNFGAIKSALSSVLEMAPFSSSFGDTDIANVTAYLNRYNPNQ